jgi:sarcosine oxidase subunit alpha
MIGSSRHEGMMQRLLVGRMFQGRLLPDSMRTEAGGRIDRSAELRFRFDGTDYLGCRGDTLASALLANGVHLVGRSFKYHRPRGILASGAEEPNALVTIRRDAGRSAGGRITPNLRATQVELYDGLEAISQNRYPSLGTDYGALAGLAAPLLPAGFQHKTFMGPRGLGLWHRLFEPAIRRMAGLGRAPTEADPDRYARYYEHCDVLVVGAGPAGLAAALAAARAGQRVILCDETLEPGGALLTEIAALVDGIPARDWLAGALAELGRLGARVMPRTTAFGLYPHHLAALAERVTDHLAVPDPELPRERLWQVRAKRIVLATGAIERPLLFPGNDRPGVMLAGAARDYLLRHGVKVGSAVVIATACDTAYRAAIDLAAAGVVVKLVVDLRAAADGPLPAAARAAGIAVLTGGRILGTHTSRHRIDSVRLGRTDDGRTRWFDCDALLMCNGWTPAIHLFAQSGGSPVWSPEIGAFLPTPVDPIASIGGCNGTRTLAEALAQGSALFAAAPPSVQADHAPGAAPGILDPATRGKAFVDFQNDVTASDIAQARAEGFQGVQHLKRYTAAGLGTDQGKTGNPALFALAAGGPATTTFRPPYTPTSFGTLAGPARGPLSDPIRTTLLHASLAAEGAVFEPVGQWLRPNHFPRRGESPAAATAREVAATRANAGLFDASTLGKIEVAGPDAAAFLERLYLQRLDALAPGRCRYAVMAAETGFVLDDGIVARLAPDRFHVTTTTTGAARVLAHMEDYRQTEWPDLRVWLTSTTEHWATLALQGPQARAILAPFAPEAAAMRHMDVRDTAVAGLPARVMRASFTGEAGWEINLPARHAPALWDTLRAAGATPYGTEAMHVMRAEKGFFLVGQETDGTVTPLDLGFSIAASKRDFVGRRALSLPDLAAPDRRQLVGLLPDTLPEDGAQIVAMPAPPRGTPALGHVTSAYPSPSLGHPIALALLAAGRARIGERVFLTAGGGTIPARVCAPCFLDPQGSRLHD